MSENENRSEKILDLAAESVSGEKMPEAQVQAVAERTRVQLGLSGSGAIRGCADFRELIPAYLEGSLSPARRLLFEDHVHECVGCRKTLTVARTERVQVQRPVRAFRPSPWFRWGAIAAGVVLTAVILQLALWYGYMPGFGGRVAALAEARGDVFNVSEEGLTAVPVGMDLEARQWVRTGKDSRALLVLNDGSKVELADRTEVAVEPGWWSSTIQLQRGQVIVEAADQGSGRLYVATGDCQVAVKGTVFSVNHGIKGSRVSVIEGEVWVKKGGENHVLLPGEQYATRPGIGTVALSEEFGWSENAPNHLAVLAELSDLNSKLQAASLSDQLRYQSDLAGRLPAGTAVYGAFPNISDRLKGVYDEFRNRIESSPVLANWKAENPNADVELAKMDELVAKLAALGGTLKDEVVVALVMAGETAEPQPVLLAEASDPGAFQEMLKADLAQVVAEGESELPILVIDDIAAAPDDFQGVLILVEGNLVVASPSAALIAGVVSGQQEGFVDTEFFQTVAGSYANGVDWLFAVDLERFVSQAKAEATEDDEAGNPLEFLGLDGLQRLVVERKQVLGVPDNRAVLTYSGEPHGLLSWTASPGPMGGLDYVSANANFVAAFVVRDPAELLDEFLAIAAKHDPAALDELAAFEAEHGINLRQNVAAPLGGEAVFALDGPVLPTPSWKIIVEVYQPEVLQQTIEWAIGEINREISESGDNPGVVASLTAGTLNGSPLYQVSVGEEATAVYYQFTGGYLIAAPDPALITQAVQYRASGVSLAASSAFTSLLPQDSSLNMSAFVYQNLAPLVEPLVSSGVTKSLAGAENQAALEALVSKTPPLMATLYSQPGQVTVASAGDLESLWLNLSSLASLGGPEGIAKALSGGTVQ